MKIHSNVCGMIVAPVKNLRPVAPCAKKLDNPFPQAKMGTALRPAMRFSLRTCHLQEQCQSDTDVGTSVRFALRKLS